MKDFYKKLQEKLFAVDAKLKFTAAAVKPVKEVDFYKQQYLSQESFEALSLPAVLVEFTIDHKNNLATITLHCCYETIRDTSGRKKPTDNNALKFFNFVDVVHSLVKDIETPNTGKLEIASENQDKNDTIIYVHLLTYECSYSGRTELAVDKFTETEGNADVVTEGGLVAQIKDFDFEVGL